MSRPEAARCECDMAEGPHNIRGWFLVGLRALLLSFVIGAVSETTKVGEEFGS